MSRDKITLRAMEPEDLELLYQIENNRELWDVGRTNVPYSRYALRNYIANSTSDIYTDKQVRLMVDSSEHGTIGIVDLVNFEPQHNRAEIGIVIQKAFRGQRYATDVLNLIIEYSRHTLHFRPKPTSLFIMFFSTLMTLYPWWPAIPVMVGTETSFGAFLLIRVPG